MLLKSKLKEVLNQLLIERKRENLATEIQDAQQEFREGSSQPAYASEIMQEILA